MTWPLPHAPASCVPSAVQESLKIDPVDGFSKLYDHYKEEVVFFFFKCIDDSSSNFKFFKRYI